jgi:hypothetical protein
MKFSLSVVKLLQAISMIPVVAWSWSPCSISVSHHLARQKLCSSYLVKSTSASTPFGSRARYSFRLFSSTDASGKKRVVFLGTPDVAATTLKTIYEDSVKEDSLYELVAVVTQPPKKRGRKKDKLEPSPVAVTAEELGVRALWPEKVSGNFAGFSTRVGHSD